MMKFMMNDDISIQYTPYPSNNYRIKWNLCGNKFFLAKEYTFMLSQSCYLFLFTLSERKGIKGRQVLYAATVSHGNSLIYGKVPLKELIIK